MMEPHVLHVKGDEASGPARGAGEEISLSYLDLLGI
jgi:hypothetical protein